MKKHSISELNEIMNENDEVYRDMAKAFGVSDCVLWILYVLREANEPITQSCICSRLYGPKQTVNSALKKMEADGFIELLASKDKRSKLVSLTEKGKSLCSKTADVVISVENKAFSSLSADEQTAFLNAFLKYTEALKAEVKAKDMA